MYSHSGGLDVKPKEADRLTAYLQRWRARNPNRWRQGPQVVATDLLQDTAFTDIKVAGFLETPDGAAIARVVQSALPFPASAEVGVMVEAIKIAAKKQTAGQVVGTVLIGVVAVRVCYLGALRQPVSAERLWV